MQQAFEQARGYKIPPRPTKSQEGNRLVLQMRKLQKGGRHGSTMNTQRNSSQHSSKRGPVAGGTQSLAAIDEQRQRLSTRDGVGRRTQRRHILVGSEPADDLDHNELNSGFKPFESRKGSAAATIMP